MDILQLLFSLLFSLLQLDVAGEGCRAAPAADEALQAVTRLVPASGPGHPRAPTHAGSRSTGARPVPCA